MMNSIIGFSLSKNLTPASQHRAVLARQKALEPFKHLQLRSILIGASQLDVWGHNRLEEKLHNLPDGSLLMLISPPGAQPTLQEVASDLLEKANGSNFELPWEGRVILLHISADGHRWTIWNDWVGSIPVFHANVDTGRIASTLEPVTVAAAGYTPDNFFLPGLVALLINGHYLSDWTLYQGMHIIPPDSRMVWDGAGFQAHKLWTVEPTQKRWEAGWDDLVDEMYELSRKAIAEALKSQPTWVLTLSSGLDSRLIAGVAAETGANVQAYTWGGAKTTDVNYSRQIAQTLGLPWKHVPHTKTYLAEYTPRWANLFGSAMTFHGMYQMSFLDALQALSSAPVISGFFGDVLAGDTIAQAGGYQIATEWYTYWNPDRLRQALKIPHTEALEANRLEIQRMVNELPGAPYQSNMMLETWNSSRLFISFQTILKDYWRGVATPFLNREYARFCFSLPRAATYNRRLLMDVFRRYYGRLAVIPGTYADEPMILTGKYLILRRLAHLIPPAFHWGPLRGFGNVQLRMDIEAIQTIGKKGLWPLFESNSSLPTWFDFEILEQDYQALLNSTNDIQPLRHLQAIQTLAYRLVHTNGVD